MSNRNMIRRNSKKRAIVMIVIICLIIFGISAFFINNNIIGFIGLFMLSLLFFLLSIFVAGKMVLPSKRLSKNLSKSFSSWLIAIIFVIASLFMLKYIINGAFDIPNIITENYTRINGVLQNESVRTRGTITIRINDIQFYTNNFYSKDYFIKGHIYGIEFLPHSKYVMVISKMD